MVRVLSFILIVSVTGFAVPQRETPRAIISDAFTSARPQSRKQRSSAGRSKKLSRAYHLASTPLDRFGVDTLQVGVTLWRLQPLSGYSSLENHRLEARYIATRVEADTQFRQGDLLRISFESPRAGYLYVIDRDWFADGTSGETNLIFPLRGDDNRLYAGRLIDIPAEERRPFTARPQPGQAGELLTIIVTSVPLSLPISNGPFRISNEQLMEWNRRWSSSTARFEMNDGAGQARTFEERQAASRRGMRQLTRDDPAPQTIYLVTPSSRDGLLFNLLLSYIQ